MKTAPYNINDTKIAELISDKITNNRTAYSLNLSGRLYYQGFDKIIINKHNIISDFLGFKNGMKDMRITKSGQLTLLTQGQKH